MGSGGTKNLIQRRCQLLAASSCPTRYRGGQRSVSMENQQPTVSTPVIVSGIITIAALFGLGFSLMFRRPNRK
jgi:hypothetical protein